MFTRRTLPVWIGLCLLSGIFLMGQQGHWFGLCANDTHCSEIEFCSKAAGECGGLGLCAPRPTECPPDLDPVCGCNRQTYTNACHASMAGVSINFEGECVIPPIGTMAQIPAGCFMMGDHFDEGYHSELPVHEVCISAFEMDVVEVTNAQYAACVAAGECAAPAYSYSDTRPSYYGNPAYADFPVMHVNWHQATAYCAWAGKRLPTEAEWEYAARGGLEGKRYPLGDTISCDDACYGRGLAFDPCRNHCHKGICDNDTHPVGNYEPNVYGLYDMAGNVKEWVNDWYSSTYYQYCVDNGIVNDPPGPPSGFDRVLRGGSYGPTSIYLRVAARGDWRPEQSNFQGLGFRCARGGAYGP